MKRLLDPTLAAAAVVVMIAATTSQFIPLLQAMKGHARDGYETVRRSTFGGLPIDTAAEMLRSPPLARPQVALDETISHDGLWDQRTTEFIYPVVVNRDSPTVLHATRQPPAGPRLSISEGASEIQVPPDVPPRPDPFQPFLVVFSTLALIGFGAAGVALLRVCGLPWRAEMLPWLVVPAGAVVLAWIATAATMLQRSIPESTLRWLGSGLLLAILAAAAVRHAGRLRIDLPRAGIAFLVVSLVLLLSKTAITPIIDWDGRSIWMFHAKQLAHHGMMSLADLQRPESGWSHPIYPLLVPSLLALYGQWATGFSERMATLSLAILFAAQLSLLWAQLAGQIGRAASTLLCAALLMIFFRPATQAYLDPFLTVALLSAVAALVRAEKPELLLAIGLAAVAKREGLIFAAGLCAFSWIRLSRPGSRLRTAGWLGSAIAVGLAHVLWTAHHRFPDIYFQPQHRGLLTYVERTWEAIRMVPLAFRQSPFLVLGVLGALGWGALSRKTHRGWEAVAVAFGTLAFAFVSCAYAPYDLRWQVETALNRLLAHSATLALYGFFLALAAIAPGPSTLRTAS